MTNANANINKHESHANLSYFLIQKMFISFLFMLNDINPIHYLSRWYLIMYFNITKNMSYKLTTDKSHET